MNCFEGNTASSKTDFEGTSNNRKKSIRASHCEAKPLQKVIELLALSGFAEAILCHYHQPSKKVSLTP
jgi:hypothetical protein